MASKTWPEKLSDGIDAVAGKAVRKEVLQGVEDLSELDETNRARWVKRALDKMDALVPAVGDRYDIMTRCSCECALPLIDGFREDFRKNPDVDALLDKMYQNPFYVRPRREGNVIYFTKVACHAEEFEKAQTPTEKRYQYCHCDWVRALDPTERLSPTHCYCSAGWYKGIWEGILERPVKVEMVKSVMQGDDCCQFAVHLPE